ncbi:hypothetical protein [Pseudomonas sp. NPDC087817]|uniref:hypothetical protein n=1 Tax=Pseudomonas sp. NPDC087817 TaxID=3364451 RepID=UPI0038266E04
MSFSYYNLRFTSDRNLIDLYKDHGRQGQIGTFIRCSLDGDTDFDIEHQITREAFGSVRDMRLIEGDRRYEMSANIRVENHTIDDGINHINPVELVRLLKPQEYVPCKVIITAFPFVAYYSKVMYLPTTAFIEQVRGPRIAPPRVPLLPEDRVRSWVPFAPICVVRWRHVMATPYDEIDRLGLCSDLPYAGLLASFAPYRLALRIVSSSDLTPKPNTEYVIVRGDGRQEPGVSDENGNTQHLGGEDFETVKVFAEDGVTSVERTTKWSN